MLKERTAQRPHNELGQVVVIFALFLPVLLGIGGIVVGIGNWYTHVKHLQTKADSAAFAGGSAWAFPCATDIDQEIEAQARTYAGPHIKADGTPYVGTTYNPQVGGVGQSQIHVVLNGSAFYDDDSNPAPIERDDPVNPSICDARVIDVKATEDNSFPLFSLIPLFPDLKRKARVEIQESEASTGLLPIAVRVPKPVSAAAIFIDERSATFGNILDAEYMCEPDPATNPIGNVPTGLGGWTTRDLTNTQGPNGTSICPSWANVDVPSNAGVVIALSFLRACPTPDNIPPVGPCFDVPGTFTNVNGANGLCNQRTPSGVAIAQCFYATGSGSSQTVRSGLQFIRGHGTGSAGNGPPVLQRAWLDSTTGTNCGSYMSATVASGSSCTAVLRAEINLGSVINPLPLPGGTETRTTSPPNVEVRYRIVSDSGNVCAFNTPTCDLAGSGGPNMSSWSTTNTLPRFNAVSARNAIAIRVRLRRTTVAGFPGCTFVNLTFNASCEFFYTANGMSGNAPTDAQVLNAPVQRSFQGDVDLSGPIKWLRLVADGVNLDGTGAACDGTPDFGIPETGPAATVPTGNRCFWVDMGIQGAIPPDQDEYPVAFNISTTSQHQLLDCDPTIPQGQIDDAIAQGCGPLYKGHDFILTPLCPNQNSIFNLPQPAPWQDWDPKTCVKTRPTASGNQLQQGFNFRFFGDKNNPSCPSDVAGFRPGRNYWNDANNLNDTVTKVVNGVPVTYDTTYIETANTPLAHGNRIPEGDKRLVTLFFTPYDSFGSSGQNTYPVVGLGTFYITGYGRAGSVDDPCSGGNSSGIPGAGNLPPPDLDFGSNYYVWGHFVKDVVLGGGSTPSGVLCDPAALSPCLPVLVE